MSQLIRDEGCPGGAVDWATLGSTPSDQSLDVDVYPPRSHARNSQLEKSLLGASEPRLVGVIEFWVLNRALELSKLGMRLKDERRDSLRRPA